MGKSGKGVKQIKDVVALKTEYESSPFWREMGIQIDHMDQDYISIKMLIRPVHLNMNATVHGGVIAALLDSIMGVTLRHQHNNVKVATISLTTQFIKPIFEGETILATADSIHIGREIASMEAKIVSQDDRILASGIGTFKILKTKDFVKE